MSHSEICATGLTIQIPRDVQQETWHKIANAVYNAYHPQWDECCNKKNSHKQIPLSGTCRALTIPSQSAQLKSIIRLDTVTAYPI